MSEIKDLIEDYGIIELKKLFFVECPIKLCQLPYPGHKNGCPNVGKSKSCPPFVKRIEEKYNIIDKPCYFVYVKFNLKKQEERMLKIHSEWTVKQARCNLYWQKSVKKIIKNEIIHFDYKRYNMSFEMIPEAMGMHVFETAHYHNIPLPRIIKNYVYKVAFMGELKYNEKGEI